MTHSSPGKKFRDAVAAEYPLQCVGTTTAYHARLADASGFKSLYLSGGGVAAGSCGIPDLGITTMEDVLIDLRRITDITELPVLVDIDTGWGGAFNITRTVRAMIKAGAAAIHIEDQVQQKRCGHRPNKAIVSQAEMVDRIKVAVDARNDSEFVVMARTDALAVEGLQSAIDRAAACVEAGADMIFPEAITDLQMYQQFVEAVKVPVLANMTEFGETPLFTTTELADVGVSIALYPLSAFRAANAGALKVYRELHEKGTQKGVLELMQSRDDLYDFLAYHQFEEKLDTLFSKQGKDNE